ncbi:hypothetical protein BH20ACT15_BH20ACT15_13180 [soil metagenome]
MPEPQLRAVLLVAGAGAVLVLVNLFGLVGSLIGLAAMAGGLLLARPARARRGVADADWWTLLGAGAGLVAVGIAIGQVFETPGGLLVAIGGALGVIAVALALP